MKRTILILFYLTFILSKYSSIIEYQDMNCTQPLRNIFHPENGCATGPTFGYNGVKTLCRESFLVYQQNCRINDNNECVSCQSVNLPYNRCIKSPFQRGYGFMWIKVLPCIDKLPSFKDPELISKFSIQRDCVDIGSYYINLGNCRKFSDISIRDYCLNKKRIHIRYKDQNCKEIDSKHESDPGRCSTMWFGHSQQDDCY
jgi:hypothetical protein